MVFNSSSNAGMGSNIGDMFYSTGDGPDGFTSVPTSDPSNNVPYQQLKCTNQIGVIVDDTMATTNFQGYLKFFLTAIVSYDSFYYVRTNLYHR